MNQNYVQTLARDIIVKVGGDGYYHGGCARLAIGKTAKAWDEVGEQVKQEELDTKSRLAIFGEIIRLVSAWKKIQEGKYLPPEFEIK